MSEKSLAVLPVNDVRELAKAVAESGLFPTAKTHQSAFALMMLCQAEGLHPMQAMRRYHIINGQPSMKADAMLAEFQLRGGTVEWKQHDELACEGIFVAPGVVGQTTIRWTYEDAVKAGVAKTNANYDKYRRQMLRARVISEGIRMTMPAVVMGLYTPEEVEDFEKPPAQGRMIDAEIVPPPEPPKEEPKNVPAPPKDPAELARLDDLKKARAIVGELKWEAKTATARIGEWFGKKKTSDLDATEAKTFLRLMIAASTGDEALAEAIATCRAEGSVLPEQVAA